MTTHNRYRVSAGVWSRWTVAAKSTFNHVYENLSPHALSRRGRAAIDGSVRWYAAMIAAEAANKAAMLQIERFGMMWHAVRRQRSIAQIGSARERGFIDAMREAQADMRQRIPIKGNQRGKAK